MIIDSLQLSNFRNYEGLDVKFNKGINILYGDNAQGKTNILEAIIVAATTKSHRQGKDKDMIRMGENEAHIRLLISKNDVGHKIDMHLKKNSPKGVAIDGLKIKKSSELYGLAHVISFSPEDLSIVKNGPADRRRFMDMELCQLDRMYLSCLSNYNKALVQKNNLIKQLAYDKTLLSTVEIWNDQLASYGYEIIKMREHFVNDLQAIIMKKHASLTDNGEVLKTVYKPNCEKEKLREELSNSLKKDMELKTTTVGPHRDDILFFINEQNVRVYGSQGQQRSVALSLKLSEIELVKASIHDNPILLLDDVFSELDRKRQLRLLSETEDVQTFITCTGYEEFVRNFNDDKTVFHIENGKVV